MNPLPHDYQSGALVHSATQLLAFQVWKLGFIKMFNDKPLLISVPRSLLSCCTVIRFKFGIDFQLFWYFIWYITYGWPLARVRNWNGPAVQQSSTTVSEPKKSSRKYAHCCAPNRPCTNRYLKWLFFQTPDIDTNDAREIHSKLVWLRTKAALGYKVHIIYGVTFSNFM